MRGVWTNDDDFEVLCQEIVKSDGDDQSIRKLALAVMKDRYASLYSMETVIKQVEKLVARIEGYDFIEPFIQDEKVSEIMINGPKIMFVEYVTDKKKFELDVTEERLNTLIQKIVSKINRAVNLKDPIVDARLEDGSRVNVVLKPIAMNGPIVTIRKFKKEISSLDALCHRQCFDERVKEMLTGFVQHKKNLFISGSTSSGKTTLLNCLCACIDSNERVITAEDSAELSLNAIENWVALETRSFKNEQFDEVPMQVLIKASLRMRPDRIIVGEIRGEEAVDMLQALNTGHEGSMSTGHANSALDMLRRIEQMALSSGRVSLEGVKAQIGSGIDYVIHLGRSKSGIRKILSILEVNPSLTGYETKPIYVCSEKEV